MLKNKMRIACIIMAHKEPGQIEQFLKRFAGHPFDFFIHLDKKINSKPFEYLGEMPQVYFIKKRTEVRWASYNFLAALFQSISEVLACGIEYEFISVMSGQDYPIKPVSSIYHHLEKNPGRNFICYEENTEWWAHAITRIIKYHFTNFGFRGRYRLQFLLNRLLPARKFPLPYKLYGGPRAMCMTLSAECARYIVTFMQTHKELRRFMQYTWGPDEILIPTLIMNSAFKETVINNNFYFIDWTEGGSNPKILKLEDFDSLLHSDKLLARKFDVQVDPKILTRIDEVIFDLGTGKLF